MNKRSVLKVLVCFVLLALTVTVIPSLAQAKGITYLKPKQTFYLNSSKTGYQLITMGVLDGNSPIDRYGRYAR